MKTKWFQNILLLIQKVIKIDGIYIFCHIVIDNNLMMKRRAESADIVSTGKDEVKSVKACDMELIGRVESPGIARSSALGLH